MKKQNKKWQLSFGALSFLLFSVFSLPLITQGAVISSTEYQADDWRDGTDGDLFTSYYNGTVFQADLDYTVTGISLNVCSKTDSEFFETIEFYEAGTFNGSSSDPFSEWNSIGAFSFTVPVCPNSGIATSTFPDLVSSTGGTPFALAQNKYYAFIFGGDIEFVKFYDPQNFIFGITDVTDHRAIAYCNPVSSFICGTTYFNQDFRTAVPSYLLSATEIVGECGLLTLNICFQIALEWAFIPTDTTLNLFSDLKDEIKDRAPFGYFTSAYNAVSGFSTSTAHTFTLATSTAISTTIFSPLRSGLNWLLIFCALYWLYKRLSNIHI